MILVPCKSLALGKSRLAGLLSPQEREALCRQFLADTLRNAIEVAGAGHVKLISNDPDAQAMASDAGVETYATSWPDLNAALSAVRQQILASADAGDILVLPIDLPLARPASLRKVMETSGDIVLVPDRKSDGTNVLLLREAALEGFRFAYGPDSLRIHAAQGPSLGRKVSLLRDDGLAFDIDEPEDYLSWRGLPQ